MQAYIIRRLLLIIPTMLLVSLIVFFSVRLIPGSVVDQMVEGREWFTPADRAAIEHELGLDLPVQIQFGRWLGIISQDDGSFRGIIQGNLGASLLTGRSVTEDVITGLPLSIELGLLALIISLLIALPIGIYSAIRQDSKGDYVARSFAIACIAIPSFWLGTVLVIYGSIWWDYMPPIRYTSFIEDPIGNLKMFIIPALILGMSTSGVTMRMTRSMMLEVLRQDYIRTAWAKGLREKVVILRHALKNALIPVVTIVGMQVPFLIGGTVIIESIFCIPGLGRLLVNATAVRDYPIVSGVALFFGFALMLINLIVDLTYSYLDPRIRYK